MISSRKRGLALVLAAGAAVSAGSARADGFAYLAGTWTGSGKVIGSSGAESIRCRVQYAVSPDKAGLNQTLTCASPSYKFEIFSNVVDKGGQISGQWTERTRNIVGSVTGSVRGNQIVTTVSAGGFQAGLNVSTNGDHQNVTIRPQNYEVTEVQMALTRSR